ncbi:hypothetical protein [Magnetospirillum moscoviense]|uniref:Uncharacterized protein n=1 Tax=Magnetospirillum moscoviense TaxID=1437059 RepID=A0A178M581_9PROT|nr:hypothetical protein [Magnetospirillum moscoviense]MBF0324166.1 hypothetical protein [Alphaproteobacteria bacterium]OAN43723.1 hypothetical protein A6A05_05095 [Magnetospirillum moscoviense]
MRIARLAVALFLLAGPAALAAEQPLPVPPPTDWLKQADLYGQVARMGPAQDAQVIDWTLAHQRLVSSGFLFDLSRRLLAAGRTQDALEWYAIALLRGHYDAGRCQDRSAKRAVGGLARQAAVVARYGNTHAQEFGDAGMKALARNDLFGHTVSPDWVCAQGLTGMGGQSAGTIPPNLWDAVALSVREEFTKQFGQMSGRN